MERRISIEGVLIRRDAALAADYKEQAMPVKNDGPCIQDMVIADIEQRKAIGLQRYGTLLQPFNGRDSLRDAYEEALDLCQYLRQAIEERELKAKKEAMECEPLY